MPVARKIHRFLEKRLRTREHYRKPVVPTEDASRLVATAIREARPFAAGKLGSEEVSCVREVLLARRFGWQPWWERQASNLHHIAGIFPPSEEVFAGFADLYLERMKEMDLIGVWNRLGEASLLATYAPQATLTPFPEIEPFEQKEPWTAALAGKRVLVVSPFAATITRQYARRRDVWPTRPGLLPDFSLRVVKAPLSDGIVKSPFPDWFAALAALEGELALEPFDVAIVGAGAFSLPLVVAAKRLGAVAFHLGGATQILFGIRGRRWEGTPEFEALTSPAWVRPSPEETPTKVHMVEDACYW
ncbi:MAG: hypothetical protein H6923_02530 [Alphaproteobacteria bacterium]|nr:hypothetical protein [Alphaproteobacteria bacterium]